MRVRKDCDVLIVQSAVSGLSQYCAAKLWSWPTIYSMGTPVREGGGKALGWKEGIEGGLQSWAGAIINLPEKWVTDPYSRCRPAWIDKSISTQLFRLLSSFLLSLQVTIFAEFSRNDRFRHDRVSTPRRDRLANQIRFPWPFQTFLFFLATAPGFDPRCRLYVIILFDIYST